MSESTNIFLTGATGFLGAFLLRDLLEETQADVYCLVRSTNSDEGRKRLQRNLESYSLWSDSLSSRIIPVVGDISQPLLGLSAEQFGMLARKISVIYHSAALANSILPYPALKGPNVRGTEEVLRLASQIRVKPVHFISSISVFASAGDTDVEVVREEDAPDSKGLHSGYAQSKWVAERLVKIAHSRGLPVCIYRPGAIIGDSQTGVCDTNQTAYMMMKICIQLGSIPDIDTAVDATPVDYTSKAIIHLSQRKESMGKVFHLVHPRPVRSRTALDWIRSFGYPLRQMSYNEWRAELIRITHRSQENDFAPLLPLFPDRVPAELRLPRFDCQNTLAGLAGSSIVCPELNAELLDTCFSYLIRTGFLEPPRAGGEVGWASQEVAAAVSG